MEKNVAMAVSNEELKVSIKLHHIHDDLAFSILSKLPLKSLNRFGCVCKSWSILFENPNFMEMFRNHFLSNNFHYDSDSDNGDTFLLLSEPDSDPNMPFPRCYHGKLYLLSGDSESFENSINLDLPPPFQENDTCLYILHSVSINGILCLCQEYSSEILAVLWNPATAEFIVIPPSPEESVPPYRSHFFDFFGFGYDHIRDDYKFIRSLWFFPETYEGEDVPLEDRSYEPLSEIYSVRSNSWRKLDIKMSDYSDDNRLWRGAALYLYGMCHWWGTSESPDDQDCLLSFDFSNESLLTTPFLSDMDEGCHSRSMERHLVVLSKSIALISNRMETTTFHISILGELGVKKSWIKLFIVGPIPFIERPIGVGKKGNICFKKHDDELVWIDLSTQIIDEIGVKGERHCAQIGIYKESLLPIGGINK